MSEVARQYNLIGETLRQGIAGMMQGAMQSKALDIKAEQVGIQADEAKFQRTMQLKQYRMQEEKHDENMKVLRLAGEKAEAEGAKLEAQQKILEMPATYINLGIDTDKEREIFDAKILPRMKNLGWTVQRNDKGQDNFYLDGELKKGGDLASDPDVAALMVKHMDLDLILADNLQLEGENLQMIDEELKLAKESGSPKVEILKQQKAMQQQKIAQIQDTMSDMQTKPVRYLNHKIRTLSELMGKSRNPEFHAPYLKALMEERNTELKLLEKQLTAAGQSSKISWKYKKLFNENNDEVAEIAVYPGVNVLDMPVVQALEKVHGKLYTGERASVKHKYDVAKGIATAEAAVMELVKAQRKGGPLALAAKYREYAAAAGLEIEYKPFDEAVGMYSAWGMNALNTPQEFEAELNRQITMGGFGAKFNELPPDEQDRIVKPFYDVIMTHAKATGTPWDK